MESDEQNTSAFDKSPWVTDGDTGQDISPVEKAHLTERQEPENESIDTRRTPEFAVHLAEISKKGNEVQKQRLMELEKIDVEFPVKDAKHARSDEVIQYCIRELSQGVSWSELRRKLGVGPMHLDFRWRVIKETLTSSILPKNEEEALKATYSMNEYFLEKLEELIDYTDDRVKSSAGSKVEPLMIKAQIDAIRLAMETRGKKFEHYMAMQKLKVEDKKARGPSIIFQNNFHIPRPGDAIEVSRKENFKSVPQDEILPKVTKIISSGQEE